MVYTSDAERNGMSIPRITQMSRAQLKASLELDGLGHTLLDEEETKRLKVDLRPIVQRGCICPPNHEGNRHEPTAQGFLITSPSCEVHGFHSPHVERTSLSRQDVRTVASIHSRGGQS